MESFENKNFAGQFYDEDEEGAPTPLALSIIDEYLKNSTKKILDLRGLKFLAAKLEKDSKAGRRDYVIVTGIDYLNLLDVSLVTKPVAEVIPYKTHPNADMGRIYDMVRL